MLEHIVPNSKDNIALTLCEETLFDNDLMSKFPVFSLIVNIFCHFPSFLSISHAVGTLRDLPVFSTENSVTRESAFRVTL